MASKKQKIKFSIVSWPKLIFSIILAQSAGWLGTIFTIPSIPTWYALLNKPSFAPPNWLFGPVWTILYTLIGISLYLIWVNKKGSLKLFFFHLFLNAIWSPIFFGMKNLGLAFVVILLMDITLVIIIKKFYKINKVAALILIPYLLWISFASLLNFSIWRLNPQNSVSDIFAQDFTFQKSREDYVFTEDTYKKDLFDFNLKKAAYQKNQTLSLKEELRLATYTFINSRNNLIKNYLTMLRIKILESKGIDNSRKEDLYAKLDQEISWYADRKNKYDLSNTLEDILSKSTEEDKRYKESTISSIYHVLMYISLGETISIKNGHIAIYNDLKKESDELIKLGRADATLFDRWFKDIDKELELINEIQKDTETKISLIFGSDVYQRETAYENAVEELDPVKSHLLRLNGFIMELENVIASKR